MGVSDEEFRRLRKKHPPTRSGDRFVLGPEDLPVVELAEPDPDEGEVDPERVDAVVVMALLGENPGQLVGAERRLYDRVRAQARAFDGESVIPNE